MRTAAVVVGTKAEPLSCDTKGVRLLGVICTAELKPDGVSLQNTRSWAAGSVSDQLLPRGTGLQVRGEAFLFPGLCRNTDGASQAPGRGQSEDALDL